MPTPKPSISRLSIAAKTFLALAVPTLAVAQTMDLRVASPARAAPEREDAGTPGLSLVDGGSARAEQPRVWRILGAGYGQMSLGETTDSLEGAVSTGAALSLGVAVEDPACAGGPCSLQVQIRRGADSSPLSTERDFGEALLTPETNGTGFTLVGNWMFACPSCLVNTSIWNQSQLGVQAWIDIGSSEWALINPENGESIQAVGTTAVFSPQVIWRTSSPVSGENSFGFSAGVGPSLRWVGGSIGNSPAMREWALGRRQAAWLGADAFFTVQMNQIAITPRMSVVAGDLDGLTGFQFFVTAALLGAVRYTEGE